MERRNTIQKTLVLQTVQQLHRHVTADGVYEAIHPAHPAVGKATVYRNLSLLAQEGKLRRVEIPNGPDCYDYLLTEHYHVRCVHCGEVFDVDMDAVKGLEANVRNTHGMVFLGYDILFKGICPNCQAKYPTITDR